MQEDVIGRVYQQGDGFVVRLADQEHRIGVDPYHQSPLRFSIDGHIHDLHVALGDNRIFVHIAGETYVVELVDAASSKSGVATGLKGAVVAPMPGVVISVHAQPGDAVKEGQLLMVIESMKLQTHVTAPVDGVVQALHVAPGATFNKGHVLITFR